MSTPFVPLKAIQSWYDDTPGFITPSLYLLDATVTSMQNSYDTVDDLPGLVATTGNYNASTGISAGAWPLFSDNTAGVMELSLPSATWTSTDAYSLTFRWIAISIAAGYLLTVADFGAAQTLTNQRLSLNTSESTYLPGSYPVFRWRKA